MHILLVEDNPADAKLVQLMLETSDVKGAELTHVDSFVKALATLQKQEYDVILLDLGLPDAHGLDLVNKLRATTMTPIVVLSGTGDEEIATMAVREGAQDYLVKGHVDEVLLARSLRSAIERGQELKRLSALAVYDALTGLQNRRSFWLSFEQVLRRAPRERHPVARMGGDEFVVVLSSIKKPADAELVAEKIRRAIDQPIEVDGRPAHVTASIGVSFYPEDAEDAQTLIRLADEAMYDAKHGGKNRVALHAEHPKRREA